MISPGLDGARQSYSSLLEKSVPSHPACCTVDTRGCLPERKVSVMCEWNSTAISSMGLRGVYRVFTFCGK